MIELPSGDAANTGAQVERLLNQAILCYMKLLLTIALLLACCVNVLAQDPVSPQERGLLERLSHDSSFTVMDSEYLDPLNAQIREIYMAYLNKSPATIKVFKRERVGWEGQYTMTWFTVNHGKVTIVEAYFGDPSGSGELQYVRVYDPEVLKLGYVDKDRKFTLLLFGEATRNKQLAIGYRVGSEQRTKVF